MCSVIRTNMCNKYAHEIIANHDNEIFEPIWTFFHSGQVPKVYYYIYCMCAVSREINSLFALRFRDRCAVLFATNFLLACNIDGSVVLSLRKRTNSLHP